MRTVPENYWRTYQRLEWFYNWGTLLLVPAFLIFFSALERLLGLAARSPGDMALILTGISWLILRTISGISFSHFPCPRCGKSFLGISGTWFLKVQQQPSNERGKKCAHCGLPRGASSVDEGIASEEQPKGTASPTPLRGDPRKAKGWGVVSLIVFLVDSCVSGVTYLMTVPIPGISPPLFAISAIPFAAMLAFPRQLTLHRHLLHAVPRTALLLCFFVVLYAVLTYAIVGSLLEHGDPVEENGAFVLRAGGKQIRVLTPAEYDQCLSYQVRRFSGILMVFAVFPTVFFLYYPSGSQTCPSTSPFSADLTSSQESG
jgi:hypothetical protein